MAQTFNDGEEASSIRSKINTHATEINGLIANYGYIPVDAGAMVARTTNGATPDTEEYATNDIMSDHFLFDGATTNEGVQFRIAMPIDWDASTVKMKIYWDAASGASPADGVVWSVSATALANDDAMDSALGTAQTVTDAVIVVGDVHITDATPAITIGNAPTAGDLVIFQIERLQDDASDTMAEDAKLLHALIQYKQATSLPTGW